MSIFRIFSGCEDLDMKNFPVHKHMDSCAHTMIAERLLPWFRRKISSDIARLRVDPMS